MRKRASHLVSDCGVVNHTLDPNDMHRYLSAFFLSAALIVPVGTKADKDDHREHDRRYYDRDAHDWHEWNEREERAYRRYLDEQRREYHEWAKASKREQREYWKWRHAHRDDDDRR
jgi:hypothetical protein